MDIKEDYVSYEVAKLLKEKGFHEPCIATYNLTTKDFAVEEVYQDWTICWKTYVSAPTLQMACKWLREVHKLNIEVFVTYKDKIPHYQWRIERLNNQDTIVETPCCSTYEEAVEAAIKYAFRKIDMKPEGSKHYNFPAKRDYHPKKGYINWWEDITDCIARNVRKLMIRKEIENETNRETN